METAQDKFALIVGAIMLGLMIWDYFMERNQEK
jgi:hypothetical protein